MRFKRLFTSISVSAALLFTSLFSFGSIAQAATNYGEGNYNQGVYGESVSEGELEDTGIPSLVIGIGAVGLSGLALATIFVKRRSKSSKDDDTKADQ